MGFLVETAEIVEVSRGGARGWLGGGSGVAQGWLGGVARGWLGGGSGVVGGWLGGGSRVTRGWLGGWLGGGSGVARGWLGGGSGCVVSQDSRFASRIHKTIPKHMIGLDFGRNRNLLLVAGWRCAKCGTELEFAADTPA